MKFNKVFSLLLAVVAGMVMVSCKPKADVKYDSAACEAAMGMYKGQWLLEEKDKPENKSVEEGYFTIEPTEDRNVAKVFVSFQNAGKPETHEDICNIAHRGENGFIFYNNIGKTFGTKFSGEIYPDKTADMQFSMEIKVNRKLYTYYFHFKADEFIPANK